MLPFLWDPNIDWCIWYKFPHLNCLIESDNVWWRWTGQQGPIEKREIYDILFILFIFRWTPGPRKVDCSGSSRPGRIKCSGKFNVFLFSLSLWVQYNPLCIIYSPVPPPQDSPKSTYSCTFYPLPILPKGIVTLLSPRSVGLPMSVRPSDRRFRIPARIFIFAHYVVIGTLWNCVENGVECIWPLMLFSSNVYIAISQ